MSQRPGQWLKCHGPCGAGGRRSQGQQEGPADLGSVGATPKGRAEWETVGAPGKERPSLPITNPSRANESRQPSWGHADAQSGLQGGGAGGLLLPLAVRSRKSRRS